MDFKLNKRLCNWTLCQQHWWEFFSLKVLQWWLKQSLEGMQENQKLISMWRLKLEFKSAHLYDGVKLNTVTLETGDYCKCSFRKWWCVGVTNWFSKKGLKCGSYSISDKKHCISMSSWNGLHYWRITSARLALFKPMDSQWANEPAEESKLAEENCTFLWECTVSILYLINLSGVDNASVFSLKQNLNILGFLLLHFLAELDRKADNSLLSVCTHCLMLQPAAG